MRKIFVLLFIFAVLAVTGSACLRSTPQPETSTSANNLNSKESKNEETSTGTASGTAPAQTTSSAAASATSTDLKNLPPIEKPTPSELAAEEALFSERFHPLKTPDTIDKVGSSLI